MKNAQPTPGGLAVDRAKEAAADITGCLDEALFLSTTTSRALESIQTLILGTLRKHFPSDDGELAKAAPLALAALEDLAKERHRYKWADRFSAHREHSFKLCDVGECANVRTIVERLRAALKGEE